MTEYTQSDWVLLPLKHFNINKYLWVLPLKQGNVQRNAHQQEGKGKSKESAFPDGHYHGIIPLLVTRANSYQLLYIQWGNFHSALHIFTYISWVLLLSHLEAQRAYVICPKSHSWYAVEVGLELRQSGSRIHILNITLYCPQASYIIAYPATCVPESERCLWIYHHREKTVWLQVFKLARTPLVYSTCPL